MDVEHLSEDFERTDSLNVDEPSSPPTERSYSDILLCVQQSKWMKWFTEKFVSEIKLDENLSSTHQWSLNYREASIYLEEDLIACLFILLLAFFEKPAIGQFHMPELFHASFELIFLTIIGVLLVAKFKWMGWKNASSHWRTIIKTLVLLLMIIEAIVVVVRRDSHFRVTRSLRPILIIDNFYLGAVRRVIRQMIQSLKAFLDMLLLLLFFMLLFAISGFYLFSSIPNYDDFDTLWNSFIALFVLLTTANFPDVMMPAYRQNPIYVLFFVAYLFVNFYFFLNIMLAVVYNSFSVYEREKFRKLFLHRREACENAYKLLSNENGITFEHFSGMMNYYKPKSRFLERYLMFRTLANKENRLVISLEEFYNIYEVLDLKWRDATVTVPWYSKCFDSPVLIELFKHIRALTEQRIFAIMVYCVIAFAGIFQIVDISIDYDRWRNTNTLWPSAVTLSIVIICFYVFELTLKMLSFGVERFFQSRWNCFDFTIVFISLLTLILFENGVVPRITTSVFALRALRLLNLFRKTITRHRDILGPFAFIIIKRFASVTAVVLIVFYSFAILAMEFFGNFNLQDCCKNTTIEQYYSLNGNSFYYLNNFGDLIKSFATLFELMVANNWQIIMKSYVIVTGTNVSSLFFLIFYLTSLLVMTILIAFVIDTIQFQIEYKHRFGDETLNARIEAIIALYSFEIEQIQTIDEPQNTRRYATLTRVTRRMLRPQSFWNPFSPSSELQGIHLGRFQNELNEKFSNIQNINSVFDSNQIREFKGAKFRDKFSYSLRMYSREIQNWTRNS